MPPQKSVSPLGAVANRMKESVQKHAADPIDWGAGGLSFPPGIVGGVLEVEECRIEETPASAKKYPGEPRLRLSFAAKEPVYHTDPRTNLQVKVRGRHYYEFVYICDTTTSDGKPTSFDENVAKLMNTLKKLAGQDCFGNNPEPGAIEEVARGIEDSDPPIYVRFDTNEGKMQTDAKGNPKINPATKQPYVPQVFVNWGEVIQDYQEAEGEPAMQDESAAAASAATQRAAAPKANGSPAKPTPPAPQQPAVDEVAAPADDDELAQLLELANQEQEGNIEGEENQRALLQKGVEAGLDIKAMKALDTWQDVCSAIREKLAGGAAQPAAAPEPEAPAAAAEPEAPKAGTTMTWVPPGQVHPKTKKQVRMSVLVSGVNTTAKTCIIKDSASGRIIMNNAKPPKPLSVPWDQLEAA